MTDEMALNDNTNKSIDSFQQQPQTQQTSQQSQDHKMQQQQNTQPQYHAANHPYRTYKKTFTVYYWN